MYVCDAVRCAYVGGGDWQYGGVNENLARGLVVVDNRSIDELNRELRGMVHAAIKDSGQRREFPGGVREAIGLTGMNYREQINALLDKQDVKGVSKYGTSLEQSDAEIGEKLQHLAEELVDGLRYVLWVQDELSSRMCFDTYQQLAERTANTAENNHERYKNFSMGLVGETGEVVDYLKKVVYHGHEIDKDKLCRELGDCQWYLSTIATTAGIKLSEVGRVNIEKLRARYPEGFSKERSKNRAGFKLANEAGRNCDNCRYGGLPIGAECLECGQALQRINWQPKEAPTNKHCLTCYHWEQVKGDARPFGCMGCAWLSNWKPKEAVVPEEKRDCYACANCTAATCKIAPYIGGSDKCTNDGHKHYQPKEASQASQ